MLNNILLALLYWLFGFAKIYDGLVHVFTFGKVSPSTSLTVIENYVKRKFLAEQKKKL